jgi:type IV secretory pathway VirB10-like protein
MDEAGQHPGTNAGERREGSSHERRKLEPPAPIHLDVDAEEEVAQPSPAVEEQKTAPPAIQQNLPANKRIQDFATRANLTGKEGIDRKKLVLLAVGLASAVLFFLVTQFQSKPVQIGDVPSFSDTQQKWEDPQPYKPQPASAATAQMQETNALKETSLVFVRTPDPGSSSHEDAGDHLPVLQLQEGTRIEARLETQISSDLHAPVVAVVENTYAVGNTVLVPAGARIFGKLSQADTQGNVGVDFTEIDLLDGSREKIEAIGTSTEMGPIKGNVYGKRNGRNFLIRALSGLGSTAMMVVGNNVNGAYSEGDMIRERAADNLGMATDSQLMQLNGGTRISISVPANTKIYVVWMQHQKGPDASAAAKANTAP